MARVLTVVPPGFCLNCLHHAEAHGPDGFCDTEVSDYGELDCRCPGLRLCPGCEEPPARHVCGL